MSMSARKQGWATYPVFFWCIGMVFVGVLLFVYSKVRTAQIVMLDEKGQIPDAKHP
jgi:hypothetical protein